MEIKALLEGSRSSTNWASYESTSKEVQGCTQRTHPRVMGSSKFVEAYEHDPRGQQKIITLIQVLEGSGQG